MAFTARSVKVPPNSASLEEARQRVFDFFKTACRSIPSIINIYNLDDVVTVSQLCSTIASGKLPYEIWIVPFPVSYHPLLEQPVFGRAYRKMLHAQ
ncbi:hypothetical protein TorRG33x02_316710 [Trema orientale]|uniref:Uncharacterized protein n=1 Tax=Trema orientale TaxID=63057 RepID=A0A2P5BLG8_TREOI|nr:hypothetical protein TorRG33x02_316710 [Trema orientale]